MASFLQINCLENSLLKERRESIIKIEYVYTFQLTREQVWSCIQDEEALKKAIPGCKTFQKLAENEYSIEMGLSVGPVKGVFTGEVRQTDQEAPSFYRLHLKGKGKPGEVDAVADMQLQDCEEGTQILCTADVKVTGVLASVGQRIMNGVAKLMMGQFFKSMDKEMKLKLGA